MMDDTRITTKIFKWDMSNNGYWTSKVCGILEKCTTKYVFDYVIMCNLNSFHDELLLKCKEEWMQTIQMKPKLRTYVQFKVEFHAEKYVLLTLERGEDMHM
jgi:hypothetical protein